SSTISKLIIKSLLTPLLSATDPKFANCGSSHPVQQPSATYPSNRLILSTYPSTSAWRRCNLNGNFGLTRR
ncbi:hypothetical protein C8F04DRAFT_1139539, partial [Mycena alexandri]